MALRIGDSGSIGWKALLIGAIVLLLLIPLTMLRGLVNERSAMREQAYARVAEGWGGKSVVGGPMLIVPTERFVIENNERRLVRADLYLLPSELDLAAKMHLEPDPRYVGIYAVPVYQSTIKMEGHFDTTALEPYLHERVTYLWQHARIRLPLEESRSLREIRAATFSNTDLKLGPAAPGLYRGVEADFDMSSLTQSKSIPFRVEMVIAGTREFSILPLGSTTRATMESDWPHPAFQGGFLPVERTVTGDGFSARWQVLELNRGYRAAWMEGEVNEQTLLSSAIGVGLYQAVDVYQRAERAIKYALLFIALTFMTFFAWEQLSGLRLHPLQYLLVGLALSMFYVLLIAFSEHMRFLLAYAIAAASLVGLMGIYISGALRSVRRGLGVGLAMTVVYGLLYALILSEDYALLLGAITLFAALAAVMIATRKIDWYAARTAS